MLYSKFRTTIKKWKINYFWLYLSKFLYFFLCLHKWLNKHNFISDVCRTFYRWSNLPCFEPDSLFLSTFIYLSVLSILFFEKNCNCFSKLNILKDYKIYWSKINNRMASISVLLKNNFIKTLLLELFSAQKCDKLLFQYFFQKETLHF